MKNESQTAKCKFCDTQVPYYEYDRNKVICFYKSDISFVNDSGKREFCCNVCLEQNRRSIASVKDIQFEIGIPPMYINASFSDFKGTALKDWYDKREGLMTILGPVGTGKTRALYAIMIEAWKDCVEVKLHSVARLMLELQRVASNDMNDLTRFVDELCNFKGILMLDDLGTEKRTDFILTSIQYIISEREKYSRPTIITTNLDQILLNQSWGSRVASRIRGGTLIKPSGKDKRRK